MTLPNQLSVGRLVLCVLFVATLSIDWSYSLTSALAIFVVASLTDWLDGHIARRYNLITDLGKLLDPLADKILISAAFIGLIGFDEGPPPWMVVAIISREFLITGLRLIGAAKGRILAAEKVGKHKTISQISVILASLGALSLQELGLSNTSTEAILQWVIPYLYWIALIITVVSGAIYFYRNRSLFDEKPSGIPAPSTGKTVVSS